MVYLILSIFLLQKNSIKFSIVTFDFQSTPHETTANNA